MRLGINLQLRCHGVASVFVMLLYFVKFIGAFEVASG